MSKKLGPCVHCGEPGSRTFDDHLICPACGSTAPNLATWNRRTPGEATKVMIKYAKTVTETAREMDQGQGFTPGTLEMIQDMEAFLAEWAEPAIAPSVMPAKSSPWKCAICGEPVRIANDLMPRHLRNDINRAHAAELSDEDRKILADGLRLTD